MFLVENGFVNITISRRVLSANFVTGLLLVSSILSQSRSVHKIEQVAVVGAEVQQGQSLGNAVGLEANKKVLSS